MLTNRCPTNGKGVGAFFYCRKTRLVARWSVGRHVWVRAHVPEKQRRVRRACLAYHLFFLAFRVPCGPSWKLSRKWRQLPPVHTKNLVRIESSATSAVKDEFW